jgi:hypothetical protein
MIFIMTLWVPETRPGSRDLLIFVEENRRAGRGDGCWWCQSGGVRGGGVGERPVPVRGVGDGS